MTSRYGKLTPLAQTLQEDPSLQLCSILQKYYLESDPSYIEMNLRESEIPQLFTLRQVKPTVQLLEIGGYNNFFKLKLFIFVFFLVEKGVIVLSRQWKNTLYTPLMPQHTGKSRIKPLNVTITVPDIQEVSEVTICREIVLSFNVCRI
ncbi:hypothetical protein NQ314_000368 [Rhamnusium bicolor]|uniref:Uncharacterized protein n=1 Tax=Rhamnusium bicolor TaxID=1586634 RepID=A0AAV8ZU88_9CUCU|nr:hypothetical protein NQ314_000368 [Rhamnusium bicolor]